MPIKPLYLGHIHEDKVSRIPQNVPGPLNDLIDESTRQVSKPSPLRPRENKSKPSVPQRPRVPLMLQAGVISKRGVSNIPVQLHQQREKVGQGYHTKTIIYEFPFSSL